MRALLSRATTFGAVALLASSVIVAASATAAAAVSVPSGSITVPTAGSFLYLNSQPGDPIGGGHESLFTFQDSRITTDFPEGNSGLDGLVEQTPTSTAWTVELASAMSQPLHVGSYTGAELWPHQDIRVPGLLVGRGDGPECTTASSQFDINEASWDDTGALQVVDVSFEQHCDAAEAALFGRFHYEAGMPPPLNDEAPVITVSDVAADAEDASGAFVEYHYLAHDDWDGDLELDCTPPSGSKFPIGDTTVQCTATDSTGHTSTASFTVAIHPPIIMSLGTITGTIATNSRDVVLTGTVNCSRDALVEIDGALVQNLGQRATALGSGQTSVQCTAPTSPWTFTVPADAGRYLPGKATFNGGLHSCGYSCHTVEVSGSVTIGLRPLRIRALP